MIKSWNTRKKTSSLVCGRPRPRVRPLWRSRWVAVFLSSILIGLSVCGAWWGWQSGAIVRAGEQVKRQLIAVSAKVGLQVNDVLVMGRKETSRKALLSAIRLSRGTPILAFDLKAAQQRIEALPWVRWATVERMFPDTVLVTINERRPLVLWQHMGRFALIDFDGEVILRKGLERFANLLVVVGEGAPNHAASLLATLGTEPELMRLVKAAVWVSKRRWNLRLDGDIDVRLPEEDPAAAWRRLAEYERTHRVLERDVQVLDLRIPDRLIVRKVPKTDKKLKDTGQET